MRGNCRAGEQAPRKRVDADTAVFLSMGFYAGAEHG